MKTQNRPEKLFAKEEFVQESKTRGVAVTYGTIRSYQLQGLIPKPKHIPGQGIRKYYPESTIERIKTIQALLERRLSLKEIKDALGRTHGLASDTLDYITTRPTIELEQSAAKMFAEGKTLNEMRKDRVIRAREKELEEFQKKYDPTKYKKLKYNFFGYLERYKDLFDGWTEKELLDYFGFRPDGVDFSDGADVRRWKMEFFERLEKFLEKEKHKAINKFDKDIAICRKNVTGYRQMIKELKE